MTSVLSPPLGRRVPASSAADPSNRPAKLLLFVTVALYCRPQGITQFVILAVLGVLLVPALLTRGRQLAFGGLGLHAALLSLGIALADYASEGAHSSVIAAATVLVPLVIARVVVNRLSLVEMAVTAERAVLVLLVLSLLAGILDPSVGLTQELATQGTLRGVFDHRNTLGYVAMMGVAFSITRWVVFRHEGRRLLVVPRAVVYGAALLWAGSTTAIVVCVLLVAMAPFLSRNGDVSRLRGRVIAVGLIGATVFPFVVLNLSSLLGAFDKESSFDGRLAIWQGTIDVVRQQPWTGYGRLDYLQPGNEFADFLAGSIGYYVRSPHNSFLALAAQSGIVVAVIGVCLWLRVTWAVLDRRMGVWGPAAVLLPMLALVFLIDNLVENRQFLEIGWFLMCVQAFLVDEARARVRCAGDTEPAGAGSVIRA